MVCLLSDSSGNLRIDFLLRNILRPPMEGWAFKPSDRKAQGA